MDYLLDTNIILIYSKNDQLAREIEAKYQLLSTDNRLSVSIVSVGEAEAAILKTKIGEKRKDRIRDLIDRLTEFGIDFKEVVRRYAEIDAFSQGKLGQTAVTARNMGKNDIWIAATASVFDLTLVTTDKDFEHLKGQYLKLEYIPLEDFR